MDKSIKKPNFFIIGAPKCGTTALSEYLLAHPNVFFSDPKEPNYFNADFSEKCRRFYSEEEYLRIFKGAEKYKAVGEGTVWYLYSKEAVPNILKFNPEAKYIVMLRNPIEMFHSLYYQYLQHLGEEVSSPQEAWRMQERRKQGKDIPPFCSDPQLLQYGEICKLGEQVYRLYSLVPQEKIFVIFYDDLKKDPADIWRKTLKFLGIPDNERQEFPVVNKRKKVRSISLLRLIKLTGRAKRSFGINRGLGILKLMRDRVVKEGNTSSLSAGFKRKLISYFQEDIENLSALTGKDLSHWIYGKR